MFRIINIFVCRVFDVVRTVKKCRKKKKSKKKKSKTTHYA